MAATQPQRYHPGPLTSVAAVPSPRALRASLWCAHPRIKPGEAFSSWLHRCAFANGMVDHTYCRYLFGPRPVWNRDVDHLVNAGMLEAAGQATGEQITRLAAGTLQAYRGLLFEQVDRGGHFPWILSLGVYHRTRRRHGQQFCPVCLRRSEIWLPLRWRLAWMVCCPRHRCFLHDACPRCDAPFVFHRMSLAEPGRLSCQACGANLLGIGALVPAPQRYLRFQRRLERALAGDAFLLDIGAVPAPVFFEGLRVLARGVFSKRHLIGLQDTLPRAARHQAPARPARKLEHGRLPERIFTLDVLRRTLRNWPQAFVTSSVRAGIYRSRFAGRSGGTPPAWLELGLNHLRRR